MNNRIVTFPFVLRFPAVGLFIATGSALRCATSVSRCLLITTGRTRTTGLSQGGRQRHFLQKSRLHIDHPDGRKTLLANQLVVPLPN